MKPQDSSAQACSAFRRWTISAWLRGICQARLTRRFAPSGLNVISSMFSGRAWKS